MKRILLAVIAFLPAIAFAQTGKFIVQGTVGNLNAPAKMYLQFGLNGKTITDSVKLKNGKFNFDGTVGDVPVNAYLILNEKGTGPIYKDYKDIYLEKGTIVVNGADKIGSAIATGPKANTDNESYHAMMKPIEEGQNAIDAKEKAATPEQAQSVVFLKQQKLDQKALDDKETALNKKFIQEHPDSYVSLNALESFAYGADYVDIAPLYNNFTAAIQNSVQGKEFGARLPKLKAVALGATAPEFAEADTSGKMVNLSSFRGKYVLIDFWASWCGPCRHENPNVVKAFNKYKGNKFTIVGVSLDRPTGKEKWLAAIHKDGLTWTQVSDLKFWDSKVAGLYAVRGIPQNFLLDPDGKIVGKNLRGEDLENKLAEIFGKEKS